MSRRQRAPNAVAAELTDYFLTADTDQGMQSSWAPLVGIAIGGFGGSPEQERKITDRRYGQRDERGYRVQNVVSKAREVRNGLLALPRQPAGIPSWYDVLYVAYGSIPWKQVIDRWFCKPTGMHAERFLPPPLLGVAALTPMARTDWLAERARRADPIKPGVLVTSRSRDLDGEVVNVSAFRRGRVECHAAVLDNEIGWVAEMIKAAVLGESANKERLSRTEKRRRKGVSDAAKKTLGLVKGQAIVLLGEAEKTYRSVRGVLPAEAAEKKRAEDQAAEKAAQEAADDAPVAPRFRSRVT